jgi:hypothetical protein
VLAPRFLVGWFANGFFWQTLVGDLERIGEKERAIVRRREPPLPPLPPLRGGGASERGEGRVAGASGRWLVNLN